MRKHKANYGPNLTPKLKQELLKEIARFDPKKAKQIIENEAIGKPDVDAYGNWLATHEGKEDILANPDQLAETDTIAWGRSITDPELQNAVEQLPQILSPREMQVWRYVMRDGLSTTAAGERLKISHQNVSKYLKNAKAKVERHFKSDL